MHATESSANDRPRTGARIWMVLAVVAALVFLYLKFIGPPVGSAVGNIGRGVGKRLPYFRLDPLLNGAEAVGASDLEGNVSVVNYWGTWCPPCIQEFPHHVRLAEELKSRPDFRFYLVSCGPGRDTDGTRLRSETEKFIEAEHVTLPIYADQNFAAREAMVLYLDWEGMGYPTTLVFDRKGIIRGGWIGYTPGDERRLSALVHELLAEKSR